MICMVPPRSSAAGPAPGAGRWAGSVAWRGPGVARAPRALGRKAVGVGACHIRPAERPLPQPWSWAAPLPPRLRLSSRARAAVLLHTPGASLKVYRRFKGLCETSREPASSPQTGGRHHCHSKSAILNIFKEIMETMSKEIKQKNVNYVSSENANK